MKLLDGKQVPYTAMAYPSSMRDAEQIAVELGVPPERVYKTLVVLRPKPEKPMLVMLAADAQLDLKKMAKVVKQKKVKMASQRDAEQLTGLRVGGISALALINRGFDVFLDESANQLQEIVISAGERGMQVELRVADLVRLTKARKAAVAVA